MLYTAFSGYAAVLGFMILLWLVSIRLRDASIVDRFWGMTFVVQAWVWLLVTDGASVRSWLLTALVTVWGLRLSWHIHSRNRGKPEDYRYQAMRAHHGEPKFLWYSFFSVFLLQGLLSCLISAPLLVGISGAGPADLTLTDVVGLVVWTVGFVFEALGDWQLKRFKADPQNRGKLLTTGLWSLSRHPNYFGDALLWWGYFIFALNIPMGWWSFVGPLVMTFFIRWVSGVTLLEKDLSRKKPGYDEYVARTPAFIPRLWPKPRRQT